VSGRNYTPGPWSWSLNPKHKSISLESRRWVVMDFLRWGMSGATPEFRGTISLQKAVDFGEIIPKREHHADWCRHLEHPDATLMAASPCLYEAVKAVADAKDEAEAETARARCQGLMLILRDKVQPAGEVADV
jgi:hypothetical protein